MQVGDRIELNERAQNISAEYKQRLDLAYTAFNQATWAIKTERGDLFGAMEEIYPELEGWVFVVKHKEGEIVLLTRRDGRYAL